jgi:sterol desaturase/sphingolipid hydroxylase (fatty acid hydroxylase superfamily)
MDPGRVLPYVWYPGCFTAAIAGFAVMLAWGQPPALAAYVPTIVIGLVIVLLEFRFPERPEWRPRWSDIKADAAFIGIVQIALPQALAAVSVIALAGWMHERAASTWWPHGWPLWAQVTVVVLAVDFMRYWLHRACHRFMPLWKLHEVHHSPDILYVLNVGRFHPFEKMLHFGLDTVPFLLLGIGPKVIAGYFLMYSVNGLFQHCNVRLRYGWLNYIVGSAETHRWHHARDPKIAACNFSNTTIVWDLLFGTWRLPENSPAVDIGITDQAYPKNFRAQMLTPFRGENTRGLPRWLKWFADPGLQFYLWKCRFTHGRRIGTTIWNPMRAQRSLLHRIIRENRDTAFGQQHGFGEIRHYEDFIKSVPVSDYEGLRPFIEAEIERGEKALTQEIPRQYVRTSGTTGKPKDIPLTPSHLRSLRRIQQTSLLFQYRACPEAFTGSMLGIVGPTHEGVLSNGRPFGSASGIVADDTPAPMQKRFVLPSEVFSISDSRVRYLLILRLSIARRDLTYLATANSTTLLALIKLYREHQAALLQDLRLGTFFLTDKLPPEVATAIRDRLCPDPGRATELENLGLAAATRIADLWPELRAVVTWTCASAGIAVGALRCELAPSARILELGYISSEFRGTLTLGRRAGSGLPTFDTHFFEFVERDQWDRGEAKFLTMDRIRKGIPYYLIVTTPSGLYRYFINDLIIVAGFLHKTPLLKFLQKGRGVTNITGEKLYETQILTAVKLAMAEMGRLVRFVMVLADEEAARYYLYVEPEPDSALKPAPAALAESVDGMLRTLNVEYAAKRASERLNTPIAAWLAPATGEAYKEYRLKQGQRESQFKTVSLAYRNGFGFDFEPFVEGGRP